MLPGPIIVHKCPGCGNQLSTGTIMSVTTTTSKTYSDTKTDKDMLFNSPVLTECEKCATIFWLYKSEVVDTYDWDFDFNNLRWIRAHDGKEWQPAGNPETGEPAIKEARVLPFDKYLIALDAGIAQNWEEEIFVRTRILWGFNDRLRKGEELLQAAGDEERWTDNVRQLLALLAGDSLEEVILMAELHRYLGNFEQCMATINSIGKKQGMNWLKKKFQAACAEKNTRLFVSYDPALQPLIRLEKMPAPKKPVKLPDPPQAGFWQRLRLFFSKKISCWQG